MKITICGSIAFIDEEMGLAFHLGKPIYLYNPIPEISYKEEILGMKPVVMNRSLEFFHNPQLG